MCRSIKRLNNVSPYVDDEDIQAAALQFVRKVTGFRQPSVKNKDAFDTAVNKISNDVKQLLSDLSTNSKKQHVRRDKLSHFN